MISELWYVVYLQITSVLWSDSDASNTECWNNSDEILIFSSTHIIQ